MTRPAFPVRRPVATAMLFAAVALVGLTAWWRIPVELLPELSGESLYVAFQRPGSDPETLERELLQPLEARLGRLAGVEETRGSIRGSSGTLQVRFERGTPVKIRELELRQLAAELIRNQPPGTTANVESFDFSEEIRNFIMYVQVHGGPERNVLHEFVHRRVAPRLESVPGVARVVTVGGAPLEVTIRLDPDRCNALGLRPEQVTAALNRWLGQLRVAGSLEQFHRRTVILVDGRPRGLESLRKLPLVPGRPVKLEHVAEVEFGAGREAMAFRVNGTPAVAMLIYQETGANLVRVGRAVRERLGALRREFAPAGLHFTVGFDGAALVEEQLDRLTQLALSGLAIALVVLYLFVRQWRGVAVVAVAVPLSLLVALALLYLGGQSLNLITLFGLAVGVGMLVDNAIVVFEAAQRRLERGASAAEAASEGVRRTLRAILAATVTNAVVFLPLLFLRSVPAVTRGLLELVALAYLWPLVGSLCVAVGLVPLLAHRLAAPAALARITERLRLRESLAGRAPPDRARAVFAGLVTVALKRPAAWLASVIAVLAVTVLFVLPWVSFAGGGQEARQAEEVRYEIMLPRGRSLEAAQEVFARLERAVLDVEGVTAVESFVREEGGSLRVRLAEREARPADFTPGKVTKALNEAAQALEGVSVSRERARQDGANLAALLGQGPREIVLSGPDAATLSRLAQTLSDTLELLPEVAWASPITRAAQDELHLRFRPAALEALGLFPGTLAPALSVLRREGMAMRSGLVLADGRELPVVVRGTRAERREARQLQELRLALPQGTVPLASLTSWKRVPAAPAIFHHNGRREVRVLYELSAQAPQSGPAREALERQIAEALAALPRPPGYTLETPIEEQATGWFREILLPVLLLLYAVLAITFESVTLPVVVLVALPLAVIGSVWALALSGMSAGAMGLVGALALLGLTVNPAILLVDRMQQRSRAGASPGAAALAAVRERARPVLMTSATTVAGLWPLALATGRENEIWPPFAVVVMGGLLASTALTLLVIPVGYVLLRRLDALFGRLGPYVFAGWLLLTAATVWPFFEAGWIGSLTWRTVTAVLAGAGWLSLMAWLVRRPDRPKPDFGGPTPAIEVRHLHKVYGAPGPVGRAWRLPERVAAWVVARGGHPFDARQARERAGAWFVAAAGAGALALAVESGFWRLAYLVAASVCLGHALRQLRRARGAVDRFGRALPGGVENLLAALAPWVALVAAALWLYAVPVLAGEPPRVHPVLWGIAAALTAWIQPARATARRLAAGDIPERVAAGRWRRLRTLWRRTCRRVFGFDLPRREVTALRAMSFRAQRGMVGVLGPNGAGKTTLLRLLAGILEPSAGRLYIGGVPVERLGGELGRHVGYLPQDYGLPGDLSVRQYLEYFAWLYDVGPEEQRRRRVDELIREMGLTEKADSRIAELSGGMRQRTAVARTLLHLPQVILVDEPTVGLDPRERIRFRGLLSRLSEGRIVLFSTHVVEDVAVACERVLVLARGRLRFDGPPRKLAEAARGSVWEFEVAALEEARLPEGALLVEQRPLAGARWRLRVLAPGPPHPEAQPAEPTLEEGYLQLVGREAEAAA